MTFITILIMLISMSFLYCRMKEVQKKGYTRTRIKNYTRKKGGGMNGYEKIFRRKL